MFRIVLVNAPFASAHRPSLALTQLRYVTEQVLQEQVSIEVCYLNQDFAQDMGLDVYQKIAEGMHYNAGLGDWFFKQIAFPDLADNTREYFLRYYPQQTAEMLSFKRLLLEKRWNADAFLDKLVQQYQLGQADLVGFTSMFSQNIACFALARKIKEHNPGALIIMGGANCETPMGQEIVKHMESIDFVFSGPALVNFPQFVQYCLRQEFKKCHTIDGVFSKVNCSRRLLPVQEGMAAALPRPTSSRDLGREMGIDSRIELNYKPFLDVFEQHFPDKEIEPVLLFETSRGCWWGERAHCTFCGLNGLSMNYRSMSAPNAIELIRSLFAYESRCTKLECVDNILPKSYVQDVLPALHTPPAISIFYEVKASLSEEDVQVLAQAGVRSIQPGIEALATSTLQLMKKGSTALQNVLLLKHCLMYGVFPVWNLLVGFPGEEEQVYQKYLQDIPLLTHLPPPTGIFPVRFDRYSPYFLEQERYNLDLHPADFYHLTYPFGQEVVANLAYYFTDKTPGARYSLKMAKWIGKMRSVYETWYRLWNERNGAAIPKLYFKRREAGYGASIYDSRSTNVLEYEITDTDTQVLEQLTRPTKLANIAARLDHIPSPQLEAALLLLQERGLIFFEGDKYLSLVCPHEPPDRNHSKMSDSVKKEKVTHME